MTDPIAGDQRRATALVCHYGRNNTEGMAAILGEAADLGRPMELVAAVLKLHSRGASSGLRHCPSPIVRAASSARVSTNPEKKERTDDQPC